MEEATTSTPAQASGSRIEKTREFFKENLDIFCCPKTGGPLELQDDALYSPQADHRFPFEEKMPSLFWPNEWEADADDVTDRMKAFYEETPFPNYDNFDNVASLVEKARKGVFAKSLDDQVPFGTRIIECGCGTGQLTNFMSVANRSCFGTDMCMNSLGLANDFKEKNGLERANFLQMNLFNPCFKPGTFDLVVSNGVLHHTSNPFLAFQTISKMVKPKGYILIGLYHMYGRLITDTRRVIFNMTNNRFKFLDKRTISDKYSEGKQKAWFMDQYKNPHESKHTIGEVLKWIDKIGFKFISSIPTSRPFDRFSEKTRLFKPTRPGNWLERMMVELAMVREGSEEGGFFIMIAQRP